MARIRDEEAATELGAAFKEAHEQAGPEALSYREMERVLYDYLRDLTPSAEWIRLLHVGKVDPWTADLVQVDAVAKVYGKRAGEMHPILTTRQ